MTLAESSGARSPESRQQLNSIVARSKRTSGAPLPWEFVRASPATASGPPLAQLLRGGRGGEVRLKLYLSMTLLAAHDPHDIRGMPSRFWAEALGLPDPAGTGARRISKALAWLAEHRYISVMGERGAPVTATLLSVTNPGQPYARPRGRYIVLPVEFWANEWAVELAGAEVALLLVLLEVLGGKTTPQWLPGTRKREYGLSDDTWTRASKGLVGLGLLETARIPQGEGFNFRRMRTTYWLKDLKLISRPDVRARTTEG
jgi:hypothetical protein